MSLKKFNTQAVIENELLCLSTDDLIRKRAYFERFSISQSNELIFSQAVVNDCEDIFFKGIYSLFHALGLLKQ